MGKFFSGGACGYQDIRGGGGAIFVFSWIFMTMFFKPYPPLSLPSVYIYEYRFGNWVKEFRTSKNKFKFTNYITVLAPYKVPVKSMHLVKHIL